MPTIQRIKDINATHVELFASQRSERRAYFREHPTRFAVSQCIDGRVKMRICTGRLPGVITPLRSPAGRINPLWPAFRWPFEKWLSQDNHPRCFLATFHFSGSDNDHLGCAAVNKDITEAQRISDTLASELNYLYATTFFYAISVGIDTDDGTLTFRSHDRSEEISTKSMVGWTDEQIADQLYDYYPECTRAIRLDLLPLIKGNIEFVCNSEKPADLDHLETMIGIAGGFGSFDWIDKDIALLVSTINMSELEKSLKTAATVLSGNLKRWGADPTKHHLLEQGIVLMSCVPCLGESRSDSVVAEQTARYLQDKALRILRPDFPGLVGELNLLAATIDPMTRALSIVEEVRSEA